MTIAGSRALLATDTIAIEFAAVVVGGTAPASAILMWTAKYTTT